MDTLLATLQRGDNSRRKRLDPLPITPRPPSLVGQKPLRLDDLINIEGLGQCVQRDVLKERPRKGQTPVTPSGAKPAEYHRRLRLLRNKRPEENAESTKTPKPSFINIVAPDVLKEKPRKGPTPVPPSVAKPVEYHRRLRLLRNKRPEENAESSKTPKQCFINIVAPLLKSPEPGSIRLRGSPTRITRNEIDDVIPLYPSPESPGTLNIFGQAYPVLPGIRKQTPESSHSRANSPYVDKARRRMEADEAPRLEEALSRRDIIVSFEASPSPERDKPKMGRSEHKMAQIVPKLDFEEPKVVRAEPKLPKLLKAKAKSAKTTPRKEKVKPKLGRASAGRSINVLVCDENNNEMAQPDLDEDPDTLRTNNTPASEEESEDTDLDADADPEESPATFPVMPWHVLPHPRLAQIRRAGRGGGVGRMCKRHLRTARLPGEEFIPVAENGQFARAHTPSEWRRVMNLVGWAHADHPPGAISHGRPALEHYLMKRRQNKHSHENG